MQEHKSISVVFINTIRMFSKTHPPQKKKKNYEVACLKDVVHSRKQPKRSKAPLSPVSGCAFKPKSDHLR